MRKFLASLLVLLLAFSLPLAAQEDAAGTNQDQTPDGVNMGFPETDPFDTQSHIRFAHLAPGAGNVDIYLNGDAYAENVGFETLGDWMNVVPGGYDIVIVPAGEAVENAVVALDSFQLPRGQFTTAAVIFDAEGTPAIVTAVEDFSEPLPGTTNLTFFNALSMETDVNFNRDGVPFVIDLGRSAADINSYSYAIPVDTAPYNFTATVEMDNGVLATEQQVDLREAASYLVAVYGDTEGNAQMLVDMTPRVEYAEMRGLIPEGGTIVDALRYIEELNPYARMVEFTGLDDMLSSEGPYTLFIPAGFLADEILIATFDDAAMLEQVLTAHVYEGERLYSSDLIDRDSLVMANGNEIPLVVTDEDKIAVGGAEVLEVNIPANNGIIHVLGYVIDPTLDQAAYDLFDDAVNLQSQVDFGVVADIQASTDD
ncbi:MAG: hypothetical protein OHK0046_28060 [Anaerolineae bacterium]